MRSKTCSSLPGEQFTTRKRCFSKCGLRASKPPCQRVIEHVVVPDRVGSPVLGEGVLAVLGHLEIAAQQVHRRESEVVQEAECHEHDRAAAGDAQESGFLASLPHGTLSPVRNRSWSK
jgi:hypothetical protein